MICPRCQTEFDGAACTSCVATPKPKQPKPRGGRHYRQIADQQRPGMDWRDLLVNERGKS